LTFNDFFLKLGLGFIKNKFIYQKVNWWWSG